MKTALLVSVLAVCGTGGPAAAPSLSRSAAADSPGTAQLRFCLRADPKTLDPLMVTEGASDAIRYLTHGRLMRIDRKTQKAEPELAASWKVADSGRSITFQLRKGIRFSDGSPFDSADVRHTFDRLLDPVKKVPAGDALRSTTKVAAVEVRDLTTVTVRFQTAVANLDGLFDEVPILSSRAANQQAAVLGPFFVAEYNRGAYLLLARNPNYWKRDAQGRQLPYADSIRIDIQQNRDLEIARFRRGELHFISAVDADNFERLKADLPKTAIDAGPSLDAEMLWFNQSPGAPLPEYKKQWFRSAGFRRAVSAAISRESLVKLAYRGAAQAAFGPVSPVAKFWYHPKLRPQKQDIPAARRLLEQEGFRVRNAGLTDRSGNAVEFSVITNPGNKARARMAALIQQDLVQLGVKLNIVTLDMPSLIERIMKTFQYEACLLGLVGVDLDPGDQANIWMSSSSTHQWHPSQARPATPWEAELDKVMTAITTNRDPAHRKKAADRLQEIVFEQQPMIYLVHPHALLAVAESLRGADPVALNPQVFWNAERLLPAR